ncbi:MAG: thioredoxin family protein [Bacteroidales bacterium]|nr:thioredoxin family protein [Bacteroidales bacterium]
MEKEADEIKEIKQIIDSKPAVMLYFYNDHCAPCISLRPKVKEMIREDFEKMHLLFINSENHPEITSHYGVYAYPTLVIFFDGREFKRESKYVSIAQLANEISRPYGLLFGEDE